MPRSEEVFADGSRLVQTEDGSWLILETDLAACHTLSLVGEGKVHYNAPAPPPPGFQTAQPNSRGESSENQLC